MDVFVSAWKVDVLPPVYWQKSPQAGPWHRCQDGTTSFDQNSSANRKERPKLLTDFQNSERMQKPVSFSVREGTVYHKTCGLHSILYFFGCLQAEFFVIFFLFENGHKKFRLNP